MNRQQNDYVSCRLRDHRAEWYDDDKEELFIETREYDKLGNCTRSYNPSTGEVNYEKPRK